MSVRKFRTFDEARKALWLPVGDPLILQRMKRLAELATARPVPRGVRRFRTIEEAKHSKPQASAEDSRYKRLS
jgi:hypothetical protein